ncbi:CvpA family protein [Herpetosiphon gulosus]|uniref:Colicin V production protein n=1 Tax=Herpetosiphon gulosus TaxID=1973496 RepID=A0ABP9X1N8_9CHLR|nr:CvpA family protein [Chloroflexota bacterium]
MPFVDILLLLFVVIGLFYGFFQGMLKVGVAIFVFYLTIVLSSLYYRPLALMISKNSTTPFQVLEMLSFLILLFVLFFILLWVASYTFRYLKVGGQLQYIDKVIGTFLGLILGAMIASIFAMMLRYLFTTNAAAVLDYPAMKFLQASTRASVLKDVFLNIILPLIYGPISPIMPDSADTLFRSIQR